MSGKTRSAVLLLWLALPAGADIPAEIVILGEVHDNPHAHLEQLSLIHI